MLVVDKATVGYCFRLHYLEMFKYVVVRDISSKSMD